ncbi:MAG: creatininase family protein [Bryobacterales bacterium]|nr:creatininase family protein [Bryobacteraceae bacterium]MDW8128907.1 creatininase family protein [Bryobacterales bacterium]
MEGMPVPRRRFLGTLVAGAAAPAATASYVHPRKVLLWECTRKEFREALEEGRLKVVVLPTGSTEQHNEHLAMIHDTASATFLAQQAALRLYPRVMVATPVPVGISPHWMDRKGTLTLRRDTFLAVVYEVCESLATHGVRAILILNGHGGNETALKESLPEFRRKLGIRLEAHSYWEAYGPEIARKYLASARIPGHAAEFETSFALAAFPERVRWEGVDYARVRGKLGIKDPKSAEEDELFAREARWATAAKGEALIAIALDWLLARLHAMMEG